MVFAYIVLVVVGIAAYLYLKKAGENVRGGISNRGPPSSSVSTAVPPTRTSRRNGNSALKTTGDKPSSASIKVQTTQRGDSALLPPAPAPVAQPEPTPQPPAQEQVPPPQEQTPHPANQPLAGDPFLTPSPAESTPNKTPIDKTQSIAPPTQPEGSSQQPEGDVKTAEVLNDEATPGVVTAQLITEGRETKDVKTANAIPDTEPTSTGGTVPTTTTSSTVSAPSEPPADGKAAEDGKKKKKKSKGKKAMRSKKEAKDKSKKKGKKGKKSKKSTTQSTDGAQ